VSGAPAELTVWAEGLRFPEGPVLLPDGSILVSEIIAGTIVRATAGAPHEVVMEVPGMPNGLAFGPDGALYCANMGGLLDPSILARTPGIDLDRLQYRGGSIQRIDLRAGTCTDIVTHVGERPLRAPDDLVFDSSGGFYFTDIGLTDNRNRTSDITGIYYARTDSCECRQLVKSTFPTNGLGISPDGGQLIWTEYLSGRLFARDILGPGVLRDPDTVHSDCLYVHPAPITWFDSLTVGASGEIAVAVHDGTTTGKSGVMSFSPAGDPAGFMPFDDPYTTHVIFSLDGPPTAYVTLSGTGLLVAVPWHHHGLPSAFGPA
jgi:gluconolactonase